MLSIISSSRYKINRKSIREVSTQFLSENPFGHSFTLNIVFVGKNKMRQTASKYKQENEALPVLTFVYDQQEGESSKLLAEVLICYPQAVVMAAHKDKTVDETINKLVIHGLKNVQNNI